MNVSWALSDQEREKLVCERVKTCNHKFGLWFTDQHPITEGRLIRYAFPGRQTRICKCGFREHRDAESIQKHPVTHYRWCVCPDRKPGDEYTFYPDEVTCIKCLEEIAETG